MIKNIGFDENKKCKICSLMAYYQIGDLGLCEEHMLHLSRTKQFKKEIEK